MVRLRTAVTLGAAAGVFGAGTFLAGMYVARADPGGHTRDALTVAGTLTGATGPQSVTFAFRNTQNGVGCERVVMVTPGGGGAFSVDVPMDECRRTLFDGGNVTVEVRVGATVVVPARAVNPVPYARYADQVGTPDCPVGYERALDPSAGILAGSAQRLCQRRRADGVVYDEIVRVGNGASAFWVDRFEATVWRDAQGTRGLLDSPSVAYGTGTEADYPPGFVRNGQWALPPTPASTERNVERLYALSRDVPSGVDPSRFGPSRYVTWFQAQTACRASGKRLPMGDEWLEAAMGTDDGGAISDGADGRCVTNRSAPLASGRSRCRSWWGAWEMIGNVWEWTGEWFSPGTPSTVPSTFTASAGWPDDFRADGVDGVPGVVVSRSNPAREFARGVPAAIIRGGAYDSGVGAGVFAFNATLAPYINSPAVGFRCVVPR